MSRPAIAASLKLVGGLGAVVYVCLAIMSYIASTYTGPFVDPIWISYAWMVVFCVAACCCAFLIAGRVRVIWMLVALVGVSVYLNGAAGRYYWLLHSEEFDYLPWFLLIPWTFSYELPLLLILGTAVFTLRFRGRSD